MSARTPRRPYFSTFGSCRACGPIPATAFRSSFTRAARRAVVGTALALTALACVEPGAEFSDKEHDLKQSDPVYPNPSAGALAAPSGELPAGVDFMRTSASFESVDGLDLGGEAEFEEVSGGVRVAVRLDDAAPGKHAVHIHEKGDCSDIAGGSMGGHFNPKGTRHGLPTDDEHHIGDLGNIEIDSDGDGQLKIQTVGANLRPKSPLSFVDRALVVHEGPDKGVQPTGGAGKPIACAVINSPG